MEAPGTDGGVQLAVVLRFVDIATDALADAREEIDAVNVYPVRDGDTGTNMHLTVSAARDALRVALRDDPDLPLPAALAALSRGALLGACGNSGVILSEMLRAVCRRLARATAHERNAVVLAEALLAAADAAYAAVGTPVEGTMLSVARAAAEAAISSSRADDARGRDVFAEAALAARTALAATPDQLDKLREAGVVDAGGRGVSVILDAAETALTGRRPVPVTSTLGRPRIPQLPTEGDLTEDGPAYEVMYLLEAADDVLPALRERLAELGDSLVVVGDHDLWNVHVHVDDVGAAIEAAIEVGRPRRIRVTHFHDQIAAQQAAGTRAGRAVVAVAAGPGLAELFAEAGAIVIESAPGRRPAAAQVLEAITASGAAEVIVLPNDADSVRVAQLAAGTAVQEHGTRVAVIPSQAQVQGLAALAVHEPGRAFDSDVLEMTATARHVRHGAVTIATRQAMTMAGPCEIGDALGVIAGDFAVVGQDLFVTATVVLSRLLGGGGELVTLVAGGGPDDDDLADRCSAWLEQEHPVVDVLVYDGGQERYPLLIAVE